MFFLNLFVYYYLSIDKGEEIEEIGHGKEMGGRKKGEYWKMKTKGRLPDFCAKASANFHLCTNPTLLVCSAVALHNKYYKIITKEILERRMLL